MKNVKQTVNKAILKVKAHSPEILIAVGVVGVVSSAVMACKSTMKLSGVIDDANQKITDVKESIEKGEVEQEEASKAISSTYLKTGIEITKLYAPSVILGGLSLGCIIGSNQIMKKRNAAIAAAYATVDQSFKDYRKRVSDRFGEEIEKEIRYNIQETEVEEETTNAKGKTKITKKKEKVCELDGYSQYARFFDNGNDNWEKSAEYNLMFLRAQQQYANDLLISRGYLFLNEVYNMLGIEISKAGQAVGWIYDEENPIGDNYVDFGIYDVNKTNARDFVNGIESTILLDFNVDGVIWNRI